MIIIDLSTNKKNINVTVSSPLRPFPSLSRYVPTPYTYYKKISVRLSLSILCFCPSDCRVLFYSDYVSFLWLFLPLPLRSPLSCPPPSIRGANRTFFFLLRTKSAPIPLGPYILCADRERRSMFISSTSICILPNPCDASV